MSKKPLQPYNEFKKQVKAASQEERQRIYDSLNKEEILLRKDRSPGADERYEYLLKQLNWITGGGVDRQYFIQLRQTMLAQKS